MVDDEAAGGTETARPQVGAVAVAGEDEQVGTLGGGHDLPLDAAGSLNTATGAPQALSGFAEESLGGDGGQALDRGAGVAFGMPTAEQSGKGAVRGAGGFGPGDMQQHDVGGLGCVAACGIDAGGP